jgi:hypothetical protein
MKKNAYADTTIKATEKSVEKHPKNCQILVLCAPYFRSQINNYQTMQKIEKKGMCLKFFSYFYVVGGAVIVVFTYVPNSPANLNPGPPPVHS